MQTWRRMGVVVAPPPEHPWWRTCAGMPTCLPLGERLWRIWFGGRDATGRSGSLCVDVDPGDGMKVLAFREVPGLERGPADAFDGAGLWPSAALRFEGRVLLWYTGMRLARDVPYELAIGLAESDDEGLTFRKVGDGPVLATAGTSFATSPFVRRGTAGFEMWYSQGVGWRPWNGRLDPWYDLRLARSADGRTWDSEPAPVVCLEGSAWAGLTRPWVETVRGEETLWFSARGSDGFRAPSAAAYRLYSAPLREGVVAPGTIRPLRLDPAPGTDDWDSWMQFCPCVVPAGGTAVLFYNGNGFSRTGFGYALLADDPGADGTRG